MKRNIIISGEFTINELTDSNVASAPVTIASAPLPTAKPKRKSATERIAALKDAGVDVSSYFPIGNDLIVRVDNGIPSQVLDDDPVFSRIAESGYVAHSKLYRRWVMAKMFGLLRDMRIYGWDFTKTLQRYGYEYSWTALVNELHAQHKMYEHGDSMALLERNRWFNKDVASDMANGYISYLHEVVDNCKTRYCKNTPYKHICGKDVFIHDIQEKLFSPLEKAVDAIEHVDNPTELYRAIVKFNGLRLKLRRDVKMSKAFIDAYKGSGAFFTMKNLILFHEARFTGFPSEQASLLHMTQLASQQEGWELLGVLKELIKVSKISIEKKMAEWHK